MEPVPDVIKFMDIRIGFQGNGTFGHDRRRGIRFKMHLTGVTHEQINLAMLVKSDEDAKCELGPESLQRIRATEDLRRVTESTLLGFRVFAKISGHHPLISSQSIRISVISICARIKKQKIKPKCRFVHLIRCNDRSGFPALLFDQNADF
jgi:hypothetical protein